jgi:hypothetical protein
MRCVREREKLSHPLPSRQRRYVREWGRFMSEEPPGFAGGLNR